MRIVFFGTPTFAVPSLQRLLTEPEFQVLGVVTQPDKRRGRGNQLVPSSVKQVALDYQLATWQPQRIKKDPQTLAELRSLLPDFFVVVAYGQILSQEILDIPRLGCVNNHGSLLPQYRGAAPIQWAIANGETETGITTMLMDAGMDTGAMLLKQTLPIGLLDHAGDVSLKLAEIAANLLIKTLRGLAQGLIEPIPQDNSRATYAPLIKKEDYWLDWSRPAIALHNQIRGFYPDCQTQFRDQPLKITATVPLDTTAAPLLPSEFQTLANSWSQIHEAKAESPGTIIEIVKNQGAIVQTGSGGLLLRQVQPSGKKSQSGWDFVNGSRLTVGEQLGSL